MKGLSALFLLTAFGLGAAATAQPKPAWMLIWVYETGMLTREFPSMDECESIADHISKVRTPRSSTEGVTGAWKFNFERKGMAARQGPRVVTLCVPDASEIDGIKEILEDKEWYRAL